MCRNILMIESLHNHTTTSDRHTEVGPPYRGDYFATAAASSNRIDRSFETASEPIVTP